jgi:hypothetical protein
LFAFVLALGCGHAPPAAETVRAEHRPARPSRWSDAEWAWLSALGDAIEPRWASFLGDCQTRLPASHALNAPGLRATAELRLGAHGAIVQRSIVAPSGNADFDRAILDVLADAAPFAAPPADAASDDELVHVTWQFTRDAATSGAERAELVRVRLPLQRALDAPLARGDVTTAAARIVAAHDATPAERAEAEDRVMIEALRQAIVGPGDDVARAAAEGYMTLPASALARMEDLELAEASFSLLKHREPSPYDMSAPTPIHPPGRLDAKARAEDCDSAVHFARLAAPTVAAVAVPAPHRVPVPVTDGIADRDETVRARCIAAAAVLYGGSPPHALDAAIRAHLHDKAAAVRVAVLAAIAVPPAELRIAAADPDADVRALALGKLAAPDLWIAAASDRAPQVRLLAARALDRPELLERLAADESPDVADAALARLAQVRGAEAIGPDLLARLAAAPRRSRDRVRIALAWLRLR